MKKYFVFAFIAVAAIALSSCDKKNNGGGNTPTGEYTIALNPKSLELAIGDEAKVKATVTPKDAKVVYKSTNEEVATVSGGLVTGISEGEALIIASIEGQNVADTCVVTVKPWYDVLSWNGWEIWDFDKSTILSTDTMVTQLSTGETVHCVLIPAEFHVWDNGIVLTGNTVSGAGNVIIANGSMYMITDDLGDGKGPNYWVLSASSLSFIDPDLYDVTDTAYAYCAPANKISGTPAQQYAYLMDTTYTGEPGIAGFEETYILNIDYDNQAIDGHFVGIVGEGIFGGKNHGNDPLYISNVGWWKYGQLDYAGLAPELNEEGRPTGEWAEPVEWDEIIEKHYEKLASEEVQYFKMSPEKIHRVNDMKITREMVMTNFYKK